MKKEIINKSFTIIVLVIIMFCGNVAFAAGKGDVQLRSTIEEILSKLQTASNNHNIEAVATFYSNNFLSGDNLTKQQLLDMVKETWKTYPDIRYTTDIKDVRVSEDWGAVETYDKSIASTMTPSEITDDKGELNSESHSVIYLRRVGKDWKIVGDYTYYERAEVRFGTAKSLEIKFSAPEQVSASEMYSAKISMEVPVGSFAVGSITKEPIVFPSVRADEKFRTLDQSAGGLERVFEANDTNNNELVTATVGVTELTEDNQARPTVKLRGICVIGNRINVIPATTFDLDEYKKRFIPKTEVKEGDEDMDNNGILEGPTDEPIEDNE